MPIIEQDKNETVEEYVDKFGRAWFEKQKEKKEKHRLKCKRCSKSFKKKEEENARTCRVENAEAFVSVKEKHRLKCKRCSKNFVPCQSPRSLYGIIPEFINGLHNITLKNEMKAWMAENRKPRFTQAVLIAIQKENEFQDGIVEFGCTGGSDFNEWDGVDDPTTPPLGQDLLNDHNIQNGCKILNKILHPPTVKHQHLYPKRNKEFNFHKGWYKESFANFPRHQLSNGQLVVSKKFSSLWQICRGCESCHEG